MVQSSDDIYKLHIHNTVLQKINHSKSETVYGQGMPEKIYLADIFFEKPLCNIYQYILDEYHFIDKQKISDRRTDTARIS